MGQGRPLPKSDEKIQAGLREKLPGKFGPGLDAEGGDRDDRRGGPS